MEITTHICAGNVNILKLILILTHACTVLVGMVMKELRRIRVVGSRVDYQIRIGIIMTPERGDKMLNANSALHGLFNDLLIFAVVVYFDAIETADAVSVEWSADYIGDGFGYWW